MNRIIPIDDKIDNLASIESESTKTKSKKSLKRSESIIDVNLVSSFCPSLLLELIVKNKTVTLENQYLQGACLIADISGFVKLCGDLSKCGAEGFDDLQICTRSFIGELVKLVYNYGGDVISFAGDAIICFFPSHDDPAHCCRRAMICAFEMKELRSLNLTAHIGVSYGEICFVTLGGYQNQWVYLMSGEPFEQVSICVNDAKAGEAVVTSKCYQFVETLSNSSYDGLIFELIPSSGNFKLLAINSKTVSTKTGLRPSMPFITLVLEKILGFIPLAVKASIAAGSFNAISELREVTTMFVKLDSYSYILHSDLLTLQPFFFGVQEILCECGGFMRQFLVDDKGCVLIAVWGIPKASFPNNCSRAVSCAVKVKQYALQIGHSCSIGITTGHAYCGTIGSIIRQDYVAMGDAVNLAARLMGKSNGRILIDDNTFLRLPTSVSQNLQLAESLMLKGRDEVMQPYYYSTDTLPILPSYDDVDDHSIIIDKSIANVLTSELEKLSDYQDQTVGIITPGICQIEEQNDTTLTNNEIKPLEVKLIMVEGFPGSGKTTVADFFQKGSIRRNFRCIHIKLTSDLKATSYGMIRKLFIELVSPSKFSTERKQRQVLLSLLRHNYPDCEIDTVLKDHFPIIRHALGLTWDFNVSNPSKKPTRESKFFGDTTLQCIFHSLLRVCCTTIIIEDAHFCDELSLKELNLLMNLSIPLIILCTFRLQVEQVALHMQRKTSFRKKTIETNALRTLTEVPGPLLDSPSMRGQFTNNENSIRRNSPAQPGLGPRTNSQRRMSVPLVSSTQQDHQFSSHSSHNQHNHSQHSQGMSSDDEPSVDLSRRRYTISDSSTSFRGLYTNVVSNSHSHGIQYTADHSTHKRKPTILSKYGLRVKESNIRSILSQRKNSITLQLPNLDEEQIQQVLTSTLSNADISSEFVELVSELTGGNPYWVHSIAKFVRASGIQEFRSSIQKPNNHFNNNHFNNHNHNNHNGNGNNNHNNHSPNGHHQNQNGNGNGNGNHCHADSPGKIPNVSTVQRLEHHIVCHLERFSVQQQTICKIASIIGDEFNIEILLRILPPKFQNKTTLVKLLESLSQEGIVVLISEDPQVYSFQNELIRKTLYDFVLPSEAATIHAKIGSVIESIFANNLRAYYPSLSYHYAMGANCRSLAFKYTVKAADQAISSGNFGTGLLYLIHAQSMLKYDSELVILLKVAETALFDMSPKNSLMKHFLQPQDKLSPSPFTTEDVLNYEKLVNDLTEAEKSMELFDVKIIQSKVRTGAAVSPAIVLDSDEVDKDDNLLPSESNGAVLLTLPSYSARHPRNTRSQCSIS